MKFLSLKKTNLYLIYICVFFISLLCSNNFCFCQEEKQKSKSVLSKESFYFGGGLGVGFGASTFINATPILGLKITDQFQIGIGGTFLYYKVDNKFASFVSKTFGGSFFSRYYFLDNLFGHGEIEMLNGNWILNEPNQTLVNIFIGGGLCQPLGAKSAITIMALYNLNESIYSPYPTNPMLRAGFNIGF